jgi:tRNA-2-methylthio-N6-dimethylallyladenosine synthase
MRAAVPDISLSTDIIVGFPGETEADFAATLSIVEQVAYDNVFVFRYSPRPGTPAADMTDQVPDAVKAERNARLLELTQRLAHARSMRRLGQELEILVDGVAKKNAGELSGRTRCNRVVNFDARGQVGIGDLARVRVTEVLPHSLRAELIARPEEALCSSR